MAADSTETDVTMAVISMLVTFMAIDVDMARAETILVMNLRLW